LAIRSRIDGISSSEKKRKGWSLSVVSFVTLLAIARPNGKRTKKEKRNCLIMIREIGIKIFLNGFIKTNKE
jgi:hypothetical protein